MPPDKVDMTADAMMISAMLTEVLDMACKLGQEPVDMGVLGDKARQLRTLMIEKVQDYDG